MANHQFFYFSLQYSAIQKTVLRHDRLWSIAGISQILSLLNEIKLPEITKKYNGTTIVSGGGKFTARFTDEKEAEKAKNDIIQTLSTTLPMLEFQASAIEKALNLKEARKNTGLITGLSDEKRRFRGYGVTFNPEVMICEECGEYPATDKRVQGKNVCRICHSAHGARPDLWEIEDKKEERLTSMEAVYKHYLKRLPGPDLKGVKIPFNFEDLFPASKKKSTPRHSGDAQAAKDAESRDSIPRMAVWFSDANNMNTKVPIWFDQDNDDAIQIIFSRLKSVNIDIISDALFRTFPVSTWNNASEEERKVKYLPFRLVVAGGDDLCLVTAEDHILKFTTELSSALNEKIQQIKANPDYAFLSMEWLEKRTEPNRVVGPYSFGASFLVTSIHTPFIKIHEAGEKLMSEAKKATNRQADSINWRILSTDEPDPSEIAFERPVFIQTRQAPIAERLSFLDYMNLKEFYEPKLSGSKRRNVAKTIMNAEGDPERCEAELIHAAARGDEAVSFLLADDLFRDDHDRLDMAKLATLLELINIGNRMEGEEAEIK